MFIKLMLLLMLLFSCYSPNITAVACTVAVRIPYYLSFSRQYPAKFLLSYLPRKTPRHEFVTVTPEGIRYRSRTFPALASMVRWFKEHFRDPIPGQSLCLVSFISCSIFSLWIFWPTTSHLSASTVFYLSCSECTKCILTLIKNCLFLRFLFSIRTYGTTMVFIDNQHAVSSL